MGLEFATPQDQGPHAVPTEPVRCPSSIWTFKSNGKPLQSFKWSHLFHVSKMFTFVVMQGVDQKLGAESGRMNKGGYTSLDKNDDDLEQWGTRSGRRV